MKIYEVVVVEGYIGSRDVQISYDNTIARFTNKTKAVLFCKNSGLIEKMKGSYPEVALREVEVEE